MTLVGIFFISLCYAVRINNEAMAISNSFIQDETGTFLSVPSEPKKIDKSHENKPTLAEESPKQKKPWFSHAWESLKNAFESAQSYSQ
jgi:hypothetical protein